MGGCCHSLQRSLARTSRGRVRIGLRWPPVLLRLHGQRVGVAWVDGHDSSADRDVGQLASDQRGDGQSVVVEPLGQPDRGHAEFGQLAGLVEQVVDGVHTGGELFVVVGGQGNADSHIDKCTPSILIYQVYISAMLLDMTPELGLRERKKRHTRAAISDAAIRLFLADGFDAVSVVEIAAAAEVSKRTLFKYFPSKEDLVVHRFADHVDEAARVVRDRARGQAPLAALHAAFRAGLDNHEPSTGLCDVPEVLACYRLVLDTPTLTARLAQFLTSGEVALAEALGPPGSWTRGWQPARSSRCSATSARPTGAHWPPATPPRNGIRSRLPRQSAPSTCWPAVSAIGSRLLDLGRTLGRSDPESVRTAARHRRGCRRRYPRQRHRTQSPRQRQNPTDRHW